MENNTNEKKKILLVDDNEVHLITAELFLKDDYEIYKTKSGEEALQCLAYKKFIPDLIMLDIIMPDMDGWEVFNNIRALAPYKTVPIIFLTAVIEKEEEKRAYDMGAVDYIKKPYNMIYLQKRVKELFENNKSVK